MRPPAAEPIVVVDLQSHIFRLAVRLRFATTGATFLVTGTAGPARAGRKKPVIP